MSRVVSCLSHGFAVGSRMQAIASRPLASIILCKPTSNLSNFNSSGHINAIQGCKHFSSFNTTGRRNLYTENALGINKLDHLRERKEQMFTGRGAKERYLERLRNYLETGDIQSIFKEDLVNLVGIASTDEHLDLLDEIASKLEGVPTGWSATVMRLYYDMNQLDRALKNVKDSERFGNFFNSRSCYKILVSMLYDAQRYEDVIDLFYFSEERQMGAVSSAGLSDEEKHSTDRKVGLVALAAMAKINNEQTLQQAEELCSNLLQASGYIGRRPISLVAYIAVSNNLPKLALKMISDMAPPKLGSTALRELKIQALIKLDRYEDIVLQLHEYLRSLKRESSLLLRQTFDEIQRNKSKVQDPAMRQELEDLLDEIKEGGHVSNATIEDLVFKPIATEWKQSEPREQAGGSFGYQRQSGRYGGREGYNNDRYQGERPPFNDGRRSSGSTYDSGVGGGRNDRYQSRGPRNQYENRDRPARRDNFDEQFDEADSDFEGNKQRLRGRSGRQSSRLRTRT